MNLDHQENVNNWKEHRFMKWDQCQAAENVGFHGDKNKNTL